jgi:hypothetical protein
MIFSVHGEYAFGKFSKLERGAIKIYAIKT